MNNIIVIIALILITTLIGTLYILRYVRNKKTVSMLDESQDNFEEIYELEKKILEELKRCEKISKNEKTMTLLKNWQKEYEVLNESIKDIKSRQELLKEFVQEKDNKSFFRENENLLEHVNYLKPFITTFYDKLKNYTNYEIDNTQMALNLKERLKDLTHEYDQKLKMIDIYNTSFLEETTNIKILIKKFEEEQKKGNYPRARVVLKDCNDSLVLLEKNISALVQYYEIMYSAEEKINNLKKMKNQLNEKGLKKFEAGVEDQYLSKQQKRDDLLIEIKKLKFTDLDSLEISLNEVKYFDEQIDEYIKEIEQNYLIIEDIFKIQKKNNKEIEFIDVLIKQSIEEKETIEKLYSLEDISHFNKILEEKDKFSQFKEDYQVLNNLFRQESVNFTLHKEKFEQSHRYLLRVLSNVKLVVEGLRAIRSDEIEILEKVNYYHEELINLNLYLRKNKHLDKLNSALEGMYTEIIQKLKILEEELQKEPLNIRNVRINNDIIEKLIRKLIFDVETDIKQRRGVERLIVYYNRFITSHEYLEYYKHFLSLYNDKEYRLVLKEIHKVFLEINPSGDNLYKNIVKTVKIEEYKSKI